MSAMSDRPAPPAAEATTERRTARRGTLITLGILIVLVALVVLLSPVSDNSFDTRLTTVKYGSGNARLASDLARKLGWTVQIVTGPLRGKLDNQRQRFLAWLMAIR